MAVSLGSIIEVRPTGNPTYGGGFDPLLAGAGTDYSQQDVPILVATDGSANVGNTTFSSATGGFTAAMVSNWIGVSQGGTFRGFWQITAFTNTNAVTVDRNGPVTAANCTFNVGGASSVTSTGFSFLTTNPNGGTSPCCDKIWIKGPGATAGDYQSITNEPTLDLIATKTRPITIEGYTTTRGDNGRPTFVNNAGALTALTLSGTFLTLNNLSLKNLSGSFSSLNVTGAYNTVQNCVMQNGTPLRVANGSNHFQQCEMKSASSSNAGVAIIASGNNVFDRCSIHNNGGRGVDNGVGAPNTFVNCSIYANGLDGLYFPAGQTNGMVVLNNNLWNNGAAGIRIDDTQATGIFFNTHIKRNIFGKNATYDISYSPSDVSASFAMAEWAKVGLDCNAFYTTGTGRYQQMPANSTDLALTASPFTSDTNFTLNSTAGGGLSIRQNPCISTLPDANVVYSYIGASAPQSATVVTGQAQMRSMWREFTGELDATTPNADGGLGIPSTDTVDLYIWRGLEFLNRRIEYHYTTDLTTVALVAGTQEYTLPSDCIVIRWVEWNGIRLAKRDVDDWNREEKDWRREPNGAPFEWAHEGTRIIFRYTPDAEAVVADSTVTVRYISTPPDFTASGPDGLQTEDYAVAVGCGVYLWSVAHPDSALAVQRAQGFKALFDEEASGILEKYKARSISR